MKVLAFTSQKGGSGKTTLSGHIAVEAHRRGFGPVALIDTDPQGSLAKWWNAREEDGPVFAQVNFNDIEGDLYRLREAGVRLVVVDTPPAVTNAITQVIAVSDLVIVPTRPSPHDLRAVGATVDLIEARGKPMIFIVNAATPRARITADAAVALSQHGTVAPVTVHQRIDFAASMIDGRTVQESDPNGRSAKEIIGLWDYMEDRLRRLEVASEPVPAKTDDSEPDVRYAEEEEILNAPYPLEDALKAQMEKTVEETIGGEVVEATARAAIRADKPAVVGRPALAERIEANANDAERESEPTAEVAAEPARDVDGAEPASQQAEAHSVDEAPDTTEPAPGNEPAPENMQGNDGSIETAEDEPVERDADTSPEPVAAIAGANVIADTPAKVRKVFENADKHLRSRDSRLNTDDVPRTRNALGRTAPAFGRRFAP